MRIVPRHELEKLGQEPALEEKPEPVRYSLPIAAHEMGHAASYEGRRFPGLRHALERGLRWGGLGGEISGVIQGRPLLAAGMAGVRNLPTLVEEAGASLRANKALKESGMSPEDLSASRKQLLHAGATYLGGALGEVGGIAGSAALAHPLYRAAERLDSPDVAGTGGLGLLALPFVGAGVGASLAGIGFKKRMRGAPLAPVDKLDQLRQAMGVKARIHRLAEEGEGKDFGGGGAYVHTEPDLVSAPSREEKSEFQKMLHQGTPEQVKEIIDRGGILLSSVKPPKAKKKMAEAKKKPSLIGRVGKKIGLGALSTAVAAPIVLATIPKEYRQRMFGAIKERLTKKAQKNETISPSRAKLAQAQHWSALASALV